VAKNNNIIEINGKKYDVNTGAMVDGEVVQKAAPVIANHPKTSTVKKAPAEHETKPLHSEASAPLQPPSKQVSDSSHHHDGASAIHSVKHAPHNPGIDIVSHKPQHAKTLMRSVVSKPLKTSHTRLHAQSPTDLVAPQPFLGAEVAPKLSIDSVDNQRMKHAKFVHKSEFISHYNLVDPKPGLSPRPAPRTPQQASIPPAALPSAQHPTSAMLDQAVQRATTHEQPNVHPVRSFKAASDRHTRRLIHIGSAAMIAFALIGVAVSTNMDNIKLQLASATAGFSAGLPTAQPYGFHLNGLTAATGNVALTYVSNKQNYTVSEKPSNWDSITLKESFVEPITPNFQTINTDGETIYIYGNQNATWVNNGVWYQIDSQGQLNDGQLLAIATSI
jgi:hypothetical protein